MTITAKIIDHAITEEGVEIMSVECRYPRFIHSELMTHRTFSRNAASSRAIPIKKMLHSIKHDMAMPIYWGQNKPGMQAKEELTGFKLWLAKNIWILTGRIVCFFVWIFSLLGLHKQIANRMIEPWSHITVLITSTYWENFFALRMHPDAQPEFKELARQIYELKIKSEPKLIHFGEWYLPYVYESDREQIKDIEQLKKISISRCASVSYFTVDGKPMTLEKALALSEKLVGSEPLHASPIEHQATPDRKIQDRKRPKKFDWESPSLWGNFYGWKQNRKMYDKEFVNEYSSRTL